VHQLAPLIYDLAIMLGLAGIVLVIFQRIHQPVVLGYLVAGVIIGPHTPPHALVNDIANIQILSELGVIFLMFSLGLEFSFQKLTRVGFSATVTGLIEVILMVILGYSAGKMLGWSHYDSLFLGAALAISSTTIIIKAIDELGLKTKRFAELIFGVLIVEDLLAILLLVALSTVVITNSVFSMNMLSASVKLFLVVGGWFIVGYFIVPTLFRRMANYISQETLTVISVALCLFLVCVAAHFHYSTALGAFIMGSILAETVMVHRIEELIRPIRDIFAAVFFISVGMLIDPAIIIAEWKVVLFVSLLTIFGKLTITSLGAFFTGQSINTSVRVGFGMAQVGEFSFIIVALGASLKVTSDTLYPVIVAVSGITTFTTPYLIRFSGTFTKWLEKNMPDKTKYILDSYSAWVYRILTSSQENSLFGRVAVRLLINGIIVAIIFTLVDQFIFPRLLETPMSKWQINVVSMLIALGLASPFIWGMLFSVRAVSWSSSLKSSLTSVNFIVWLATLTELMVLSMLFFKTWLTVLFFVGVGLVFFSLYYRQLEKSYRWFEQQLVRNIRKQESSDKTRYHELAPWDTHLVEIEVGTHSALVGKMLSELEIREKYGVNIVAVSHGDHVVPAPRGQERIYAGDQLIVLGDDDQIDAFKQLVDTEKCNEIESQPFLQHFTLKPILLDSNNSWTGKTIRDSNIRETMNGLIVGLERQNTRILNPKSDTVLQPDDLILVVGEASKLETR
jgi:CPA2 family monovalent cation:H+ antiporter-2